MPIKNKLTTERRLKANVAGSVVAHWFLALSGIVLVTGVLAPFHAQLSSTTVALCYLLVILLTASFIGRNPAFLSSFVATLCFNFFFLPPVFTFTIADPHNWIALGAFLITSLVAGQLSLYAQNRHEEATRGKHEIERLYKELQVAFEQASHAEALRQSEKLKSALLDAVTHDMRTPLTSIKAAITTILDDDNAEGETFKLDPEGRREFFEVIDEETDRLNRFIENMVELARVEAGAMRLRRSWSGVDEIIEAALERAERLLKNHCVVIESERELPIVQVDARALAEVVFTLLDNAAKYSPAHTRIKILVCRAAGEMVEIAVTDEGCGVLPEMRDRVFEKFFQVSLDNEQDIAATGGLGLGLAVAHGIVESHGGRIWIEEGENGCGTRVAFVVPVGDEEK